jgi:hypothetical protein
MTVRNGAYFGDTPLYFLWPRARLGQVVLGTQVAPLALSPLITVVTALPPATQQTPIVITISGSTGFPIRKAWINAHFPGIVGDETVFTGSRFGVFYTNNTNTRVSNNNGGYTFTILRDGGWPSQLPLITSFDIGAVDTVGGATATP